MERLAKLEMIGLAVKNGLKGLVRIKPDQLPDELLSSQGYVPKDEITEEKKDQIISIIVPCESDAEFIEVDQTLEIVKVKIERSAILKPGTECWINLDDVISINF